MNILIADDHAIVRKGLVQLLIEEFPSAKIMEVVNGREAMNQVTANTWDIILMDISMPGRSGVDTLKQIRACNIKTPVLMLSAHSEDQYAVRVLKAGASGFLSKDAAPEKLLEAVHKVLSGKKYITPSLAEKLVEDMSDHGKQASHEQLSDREMQVLQHLASGKTVSEVAQELSLSVSTISTYRVRLLEKLALNNNAELTRYALDHGIV